MLTPPGGAVAGVAQGSSGEALFNFSAGLALEHPLSVVSVTGREAISKLFRFEVCALADADEHLADILLRKPAQLTLRAGSENVRTILGIVGAIEPCSTRLFDGRRLHRIKLVPRLWQLKHRVTSRIFQDLTVPEVIAAVLEDAGLDAEWRLLRTYPVRGYCVQYQESDYAFIKRLLAEEGIFYFFRELPGLAEALEGSVLAAASGSLSGSFSGSLSGALSGSLSGSASGLVGAAAGLAGLTESLVFADDPSSYAVISDGVIAPNVEVGLHIGLDGVSAGASASLERPRSFVVRDHRTQSPSDDDVFQVGMRHAVKHDAVMLRDYDFLRPHVEYRATASTRDEAGLLSGSLTGGVGLGGGGLSGGVGASLPSVSTVAGALTDAAASALGIGPTALEAYHHRGEYEDPDVTKSRARTTLEAHRREAVEGSGVSSSRRLYPGARFRLESDTSSLLAGEYTVTALEHEGHVPELVMLLAAVEGTEGPTPQSYTNRFACVPAARVFRPKRPKPVLRQVLETAVVVGPAGEEIHTDALGRIKVQFHWDLQGERNERSSCWMRVVHAWAGPGWGTQFIPRIGMEVAVTFLAGDQDCPVVTGSVYNGVNAPPFALPDDKTRSGIRTQSSLGGGGFNELSFEDAQGAEQVYLHAQRDHDEVVERDHTLRVGRDEHAQVARHQTIAVGGNQTERVDGNRRERVGGDDVARVEGYRERSVGQDDTLRVQGNRYTVSTNDDQQVSENLTTRVGNRERREVAGMSDLLVKDDLTTRVNGNWTTVVGRHDAPRTFIVHAEGRAVVQSSEITEIASEKELILRVGASRIRITEDHIEFSGKGGLSMRSGNTLVQVTPERARVRSRGKVVLSGESVDVFTEGAQVKLTEEVKISGSMIKLNPPKKADDPDAPPKAPELTQITLKDQKGRPLANQRFVVRLSDGSEIAGVLDHEGHAALEIEDGDAKVSFPEVSKVTPR